MRNINAQTHNAYCGTPVTDLQYQKNKTKIGTSKNYELNLIISSPYSKNEFL
jgi:hypothetical protein